MADFKEIMNLVEEVRDILDLNEIFDSHDTSHGKGRSKASKAIAKSNARQNPFRWLKKGKALDKGPKKRVNFKKRGKWKCKCASYKCLCKSKGAGGKVIFKKVKIEKGYKKSYNKLYRKHLKKKGMQKHYGPESGRFRSGKYKAKKA